jgi:23S rRNA (uracil1939-C5)-methyltransferase
VQHLSYPAQLEWKRTIVESALHRIGGIREIVVAPTMGMAQPRAYRNKMALVTRADAGDVEFGFYRARSHDLVCIDTCPVVRPQLDRTIRRLWEAARDRSLAPVFQEVRHVVARAGGASQTVLSLTTDKASRAIRTFAEAISTALPGVVGLINSYELPSTNAVVGRKQTTIAGQAQTTEEIDGLHFQVSPSSFFQINSEMVARIFEVLASAVRAHMRILDLYCGAGTFSLFFAKHGATVVGIEQNARAVREAKANAERNGLAARTTFLTGSVERVLNGGPMLKELRRADVAFLDPPRKGSDASALQALCSARVSQVWYLSCNPSTLARDLAQFVAEGYVPEVIQPFDMFPQTGHVEVLAMLRRQGAASGFLQ